MKLVVDASVALKWFFRERDEEAHCGHALEILSAVDAGRVRLLQPPHFLAEVGAVLARETPATVQENLADLQLIDWQPREHPDIYATAIDLARRLDRHLFDTLYHATALHEPDTTLVTADERYFTRAQPHGHILRLPDLRL